MVCRELGYQEAIAAPKRALFGEGNGHIWLRNVHCFGNESSIEDCEHAEWNANSYCYHFEDASVICYNETGALGRLIFSLPALKFGYYREVFMMSEHKTVSL